RDKPSAGCGMQRDHSATGYRPIGEAPPTGHERDSVARGMRIANEQQQPRLAQEPAVSAFEPMVPPAYRPRPPFVVGARCPVVGPIVLPGADLGLDGNPKALEQPWDGIAVAVEQSADQVDRDRDPLGMKSGRPVAPELAVAIVAEIS